MKEARIYTPSDEPYKRAMDYVVNRLKKDPREVQENLENLDGTLIKIGGDCLLEGSFELADLTMQIAALDQLGVRNMVVVHGAGKQIDEKEKEYGFKSPKIDGIRVTSKEVLELCVIPALKERNQSLVARINWFEGGRAYGLTGEDEKVIYSRQLNPDYGFVGVPTGLNPEPLRKAHEGNYTPILWCIGYSEENGQKWNNNADAVPPPIIQLYGATRLVTVTGSGGVRDRETNLISVLTKDRAQELIKEGVINGGMVEKVIRHMSILDIPGIDNKFKVQILHPSNFLDELLTNEGWGTIIEQ